MKGKTTSGFTYTIADEARDDMELLDALIDLDDNKISGLKRAITRLLGEEQKQALYEHCRSDKGIVLASKVMAEVKEIMDNLPTETKNS